MKTLIAVVVLIVAMGGFLLFKNADAPTTTDGMSGNNIQNTNASSTSTNTPSQDAEGVKTFVVNGNNFAFAPQTLQVNKGDKVRIVFKNTGGFHDLKIDEFNVATKKINGDQEDTVEFVADKAGTFEYYCSIGEHRAMGMKGVLTVK